MEDKIVPVYKFQDLKEGESTNPMLRSISKTMETTETFTMKNVFEYMAKIKKAINDKQGEIDGLNTMLEAYMKEISVVESQLGIQDLEAEFIKLEAEKTAPAEVSPEVDGGHVTEPAQ